MKKNFSGENHPFDNNDDYIESEFFDNQKSYKYRNESVIENNFEHLNDLAFSIITRQEKLYKSFVKEKLYTEMLMFAVCFSQLGKIFNFFPNFFSL